MTRSIHRRVATAVSFLALVFAMTSVVAAGARADSLTGKLEKVEKGGGSVVIGGKTIAVSGARTNICIGGVCDQGRDKLKPGLTCAAEVADRNGKAEARRLSCK